mmetsp:Transcript_37941/g.119745  ORF Transcript_37941/g.119745 Transcript_37941/m.119745 type:complete len:243 (-) Transcript_37941:713-1441(-)
MRRGSDTGAMLMTARLVKAVSASAQSTRCARAPFASYSDRCLGVRPRPSARCVGMLPRRPPQEGGQGPRVSAGLIQYLVSLTDRPYTSPPRVPRRGHPTTRAVSGPLHAPSVWGGSSQWGRDGRPRSSLPCRGPPHRQHPFSGCRQRLSSCLAPGYHGRNSRALSRPRVPNREPIWADIPRYLLGGRSPRAHREHSGCPPGRPTRTCIIRPRPTARPRGDARRVPRDPGSLCLRGRHLRYRP